MRTKRRPTTTPSPPGGRYRPWAELLKRTFSVDVLQCERCHGRLRLLAMVTDDKSIIRFFKKLGEPTEPPPRLPARGPPYWKSHALRRMSNEIAALAPSSRRKASLRPPREERLEVIIEALLEEPCKLSRRGAAEIRRHDRRLWMRAC
jgi:hypothetical protein